MISKAAERDVLALLDQRLPRRGETVERLGLERKWISAILYYGDKQYFTFAGYSPVEVGRKADEIRYQANFVRPSVLRALIKVQNIHGQYAVIPDGDSIKAREMAQLSELIFQHQRAVTHYAREKAMALLWAALCGSGIIKSTYDTMLGNTERLYWVGDNNKEVVQPQYLSPEEKAQKDRAGQFDEAPTGEVCCEAVPPFQIHEDPISKGKIEHCRFIIQQQWLPSDWVAERFNVKEEDLTIEANTTSSNRLDQAIALLSSGLTGFSPLSGGDERTRGKLVRLVQMWERPSRKHKKGRYVVLGGERALIDEDNPYIGDRTGVMHLPFSKMDWMPCPGRFWGSSLAESLTGLQFRYNESRSRMAEFENIFGRPITIIGKGAGLTKVNLEIKTGGIYEANMNAGTPFVVPQPALPTEVLQNSSTIMGEMRQIASQSEVDGAKLPGQLRSGSAMNTIQRDRDLVLDLTIQSSLEQDQMVGQQNLVMGQLFYTTTRLAKLRGANGVWIVKAFKGSDLSSNLRVIGEPGEYETSNQYRDRIMDFAQAGLLPPGPASAQLIAKALKFHTAEEILVDLTQHEERQEAEMREMIAAPEKYRDGVYPVLPYEDDAAHQRVLERLFNSEEFHAMDPFTRSVLMAHWQAHDNQKMQKTAQQLQMMEAASAAPEQPGVASQPRR